MKKRLLALVLAGSFALTGCVGVKVVPAGTEGASSGKNVGKNTDSGYRKGCT